MITIMTDTTACVKEAEAAAMGIRVVPVGYTVNGREYAESFCDRNGDFEALLKPGEGTATVQPRAEDRDAALPGVVSAATVQPGAEAFAKHFKDAASDGGEVLCITISSRLSGIYSAASAAAKLCGGGSPSPRRVTVFDSLTTAGGLFLMVKRAYEMAAQGMGMDGIVAELERIRSVSKLYFSVADISHLRNSGRIGFVRRSVETILNMKPLLVLNEGTVVFDSMARGDAELIKKITRRVGPEARDIVVDYLGDSPLAANIYSLLKKDRPGSTVHLHKFGPVLAIHLGLNVLAVSYL